MSKLVALIACSMHAATAYLVLTPASPLPLLSSSPGFSSLHNALNLWTDPAWPPHPLMPFSQRAFKMRPLYETAPALSSFRELLADMSIRRDTPYVHGWQDHGERLEQTLSVPSGFDSEAATLSAELSDGMDKVTVQGSRAGLRFSHSLSLPFELEAASDIELEHKPRAGLLTLRLRKPKDQDQPPQPAALPIKRIIEEEGEAAPAALPDGDAATASHEQPPPAKGTAAEPRDEKSEQQALEEKFAFVKQAEAQAPKAAAAPETTEESKSAAEPEASAV